MINGIYLKLGSLLANYDVKPLSKFGGNRKNRTNSTSHSLRYPGGYRFVRTVTKGLRPPALELFRQQSTLGKIGKEEPWTLEIISYWSDKLSSILDYFTFDPQKKSILPIQRKSQVLFVYHVLESPRVSEFRSPRVPASPRPRVSTSPRPRVPLLVTAVCKCLRCLVFQRARTISWLPSKD